VNKLYNATDFERLPADFYPTPPDLTRGLIDGATSTPNATLKPLRSTPPPHRWTPATLARC
jgi:hypothetical protein